MADTLTPLEAAAKALWDAPGNMFATYEFGEADNATRVLYLMQARAALTAAIGALPERLQLEFDALQGFSAAEMISGIPYIDPTVFAVVPRSNLMRAFGLEGDWPWEDPAKSCSDCHDGYGTTGIMSPDGSNRLVCWKCREKYASGGLEGDPR